MACFQGLILVIAFPSCSLSLCCLERPEDLKTNTIDVPAY